MLVSRFPRYVLRKLANSILNTAALTHGPIFDVIFCPRLCHAQGFCITANCDRDMNCYDTAVYARVLLARLWRLTQWFLTSA